MTRPAFPFFERGSCRRWKHWPAQLAVRDLTKLGVTVVPEPVAAGPAGHCVIPELSWNAYQANKQRAREIQLELGKLASAGIVLRPG